jgi:hypothetical protein
MGSIFDTARALARSAAARELPATTSRPALSPPRQVVKRGREEEEDEEEEEEAGDADADAGPGPSSAIAARQLPAPLPPATFYTPADTSNLSAVERGLLRLLTAVDARIRSEKGGGGAAAGAPPPYLVFHRQAPAFAAADAGPPSLRVFSVETATSRTYVVTTLPELWRRYRAAGPSGRRHYEILREGAPVHLYLDLEFKRVAPAPPPPPADAGIAAATPPTPALVVPINATIDGDALVDGVVSAVAARLAADHGVGVSPADVLELDASSAAKFSRHVTIRVAGVAFASTQDVGALVRAAVADGPPAGWRLGDSGEPPPPPPPPPPSSSSASPPAPPVHAAFLVAKDAPGSTPLSTTPAVDLGVYTRNRAWRMAGSAKAGDAERRVLVPTQRYGGAGASDRAAFFAGLAGDVGPGVTLVTRADAVGPGAGGRRSVGGGGGGCGGATAATTTPPSSPSIRPGPSPLPCLDAFIEEVAARASRGEGGPVSVRAWGVWTGEDGGVAAGGFLLALRGGRYCGRIGRPHASNGVFYVVDAARGHWVQRCYDPECRGYRSPAAPLPPDVWRAAQAALAGLHVRGGKQA